MKRGKDLSIISLSAISDFARVNSEIQLLEQCMQDKSNRSKVNEIINGRIVRLSEIEEDEKPVSLAVNT